MRDDPKGENGDNEKPAVTLPGVVEKIVKPITPSEPEKAQIAVHGADDLYREIRVENTLHNANGEKVRLTPGAEVDVTIEASSAACRSYSACAVALRASRTSGKVAKPCFKRSSADCSTVWALDRLARVASSCPIEFNKR